MTTKFTVAIEDVKANMQDVFCTTITAFDKPVTFVQVRMKNGFLLQESTTCVDPANYNEEIGKEICLKRIEDKIWMLLGYHLQDCIHCYNNLKEEHKEFFNTLMEKMFSQRICLDSVEEIMNDNEQTSE